MKFLTKDPSTLEQAAGFLRELCGVDSGAKAKVRGGPVQGKGPGPGGSSGGDGKLAAVGHPDDQGKRSPELQKVLSEVSAAPVEVQPEDAGEEIGVGVDCFQSIVMCWGNCSATFFFIFTDMLNPKDSMSRIQ